MGTVNRPILVFVYQTNPFAEGQGGGVRYVTQLAAAIEAKGIQVIFFGAGGRQEARGNIRYIPVAKTGDSALLFMLKCGWARWRYIGKGGAVVHVHRLYYALPFIGPSMRCIATLHGRTFTVFQERYGTTLSRLVFPIFRLLERWLLLKVDQVVVVSHEVLSQFRARHGSRLSSSEKRTIPSMVNLSKFRPKESDYFSRTLGDRAICLFVGRLASVKNLPLLLDAWSIVARRKPNAHLAIAGEGELRDQVDRWIAQMECAASVTMLGQVSPSKITDAISGAKVLLLTSHHEASPTVVKEALSCGVPVVSTPVGDVTSVIDDGRTGRIVEPDAKKLAEAIIDVLGWGSTKEEIANAAHPVLEHCSPERVADKYLAIYQELGLTPIPRMKN